MKFSLFVCLSALTLSLVWSGAYGLPKGRPFIELNDHLGFPLTGRIAEESGVIVFTNDMDNEIMYIDKVGL